MSETDDTGDNSEATCQTRIIFVCFSGLEKTSQLSYANLRHPPGLCADPELFRYQTVILRWSGWSLSPPLSAGHQRVYLLIPSFPELPTQSQSLVPIL